jgi:hypothetical protein
MKGGSGRENIVDQEDALAFDSRGVVYDEGWHRRPDAEKTRQ